MQEIAAKMKDFLPIIGGLLMWATLLLLWLDEENGDENAN